MSTPHFIFNDRRLLINPSGLVVFSDVCTPNNNKILSLKLFIGNKTPDTLLQSVLYGVGYRIHCNTAVAFLLLRGSIAYHLRHSGKLPSQLTSHSFFVLRRIVLLPSLMTATLLNHSIQISTPRHHHHQQYQFQKIVNTAPLSTTTRTAPNHIIY